MEPVFSPSLDNYLCLTLDLLRLSKSRCRCVVFVPLWRVCAGGGSCHPQHSVAAIRLMSRCCGGMTVFPLQELKLTLNPLLHKNHCPQHSYSHMKQMQPWIPDTHISINQIGCVSLCFLKEPVWSDLSSSPQPSRSHSFKSPGGLAAPLPALYALLRQPLRWNTGSIRCSGFTSNLALMDQPFTYFSSRTFNAYFCQSANKNVLLSPNESEIKWGKKGRIRRSQRQTKNNFFSAFSKKKKKKSQFGHISS